MAKVMLDKIDTPVESAYMPEAAAEQAITGEKEPEPRSALAMGLPDSWSIEPPTVVVRRKKRVI